MPLQRLIAVVLLLATTGCAATPLLSGKDDEGGALDARDNHERVLKEDADAPPRSGQWNVVHDPDQPPQLALPARPKVDLPVSELVGRAEQASAQQRLPEARQYAEAILRRQPAHPRAHHLLAYISDLEGRWGDAEHHYQLALQSDPNNASIVGDLGYSYLLQGRLPLAEQYLLLARQLDPSNQKVAANLAGVYGRRNDMQSAYRVLAEVHTPAEVERILAQLFPGAPLYATMNPAPSSVQQFAANDQQFNQAAPVSSQLMPAQDNRPEHQPPVWAVPGFTSSMAVVAPPATSSIPNSQQLTSRIGQPAVGTPYGASQPALAAPPPAGIEQASASGAAGPGTASSSIASAGPAARRWPPAIWPPESNATPVTQAAGVSTSSPQHSSSGVTYLLPRRPQTSPAAPVSPFPPENSAPGAGPAYVPRPLPAGTPSRFENPAQYATGPGASRIVTWANQSGQSLESPPLPPIDDQLHAAASPELNGAAAPPAAVMRASPGSASGWNGGFYPAPPRQLPGSDGSIYDYPQQGAPLRATAPASVGTATAAAANEPHAGFVIAPPTDLPANPLSGFEADRRQYDQQFQQQVEQSYAQSPAGFIRPPAESIPVPTYQVPVGSPAAQNGAPLTPNGTPWPGRSADGTVPSASVPGPANNASPPAAPGLVTPLPYRSQQSGAPPVNPPAYHRPSPQAASPDPYDAAGPTIVPGPSSW